MSIVVASEGERCATGSASLPEGALPAPAAPRPAPIPAFEERPAASDESLAVGRRFSSHPQHFPAERLEQYLADIGETEPLYARRKFVHPSFMLRLANLALKDNVKLGAWIHAGSSVQHFAVARAGDTLAAHAEVVAQYERKGNGFAELDVLVTNEERAIARVRHTAIYRLRKNG